MKHWVGALNVNGTVTLTGAAVEEIEVMARGGGLEWPWPSGGMTGDVRAGISWPTFSPKTYDGAWVIAFRDRFGRVWLLDAGRWARVETRVSRGNGVEQIRAQEGLTSAILQLQGINIRRFAIPVDDIAAAGQYIELIRRSPLRNSMRVSWDHIPDMDRAVAQVRAQSAEGKTVVPAEIVGRMDAERTDAGGKLVGLAQAWACALVSFAAVSIEAQAEQERQEWFAAPGEMVVRFP